MPHYFKMRARDTACVPLTYHTWITVSAPDPTGSQSGVLPCGAGPGDLADIQVVQDWVVPDDVPLQRVLHVDETKGNDSTATGSLSLPFATIQGAVDLTTSTGEWHIVVSPGTYAAAITIPDQRQIVISGSEGGSTFAPATTIGAISVTSSVSATKLLSLKHLQSGTVTVSGVEMLRFDLEHAVVSGNVTGPLRMTVTGTRRAAGSTSQVTGTTNIDFDLYASGALLGTVAGTSNLQADYTFISSITGADTIFLRNDSRVFSAFTATMAGALNLHGSSDMSVGAAGSVGATTVLNSSLTMDGTVTGAFSAVSSILTMDLSTATFGDDFEAKECSLGWTGTTLSIGGDVCRISNCTHESATATPLTVNFTGPAGFLYADSGSITRTVDSSNVVQNGVNVTNGTFIQLTRPSALTRTLYVDNGVGDNVIGNGTSSNPYASVQRAITDTSNDGTYHIIVSPGDYSGDATISIPDNREIVLEGADSICGGPPVAPAVTLGDIAVALDTAGIQELHMRHMQVGDVTFVGSGTTGLATFEHCVAGTVSGAARIMAWGALNSTESTTTITSINVTSSVIATSCRLNSVVCSSVILNECNTCTLGAITGATLYNCSQINLTGNIGNFNSKNSEWSVQSALSITTSTIVGGEGTFDSNATFSGAFTAENASLFIGTEPTIDDSFDLRGCKFHYNPTTLTIGGVLCRLAQCTHLSNSGGNLSVVFSGSPGDLIADRASLARTDLTTTTIYTVTPSNGTLTELDPAGAGPTGPAGGATTLEYTFSTTTTDSDPGNGILRLSNATQNASTVIRVDLLDALGADVTSVLDIFDDSAGGLKGFIRLVNKDDTSNWLLFSVSTLSTPSGYRNVTVTNIGFSSASPFSDSDTVLLCFDPMGAVAAVQDFGLTHSPAGVWNFNEVLTDSSGNTIDFSVISGGALYTEFHPGKKGLYVRGTDLFETASGTALEITGDVTVMVMCRLVADVTDEIGFLVYDGAQGTTANIEATNQLWGLQAIPGTAPTVTLKASSESGAGVNDDYTMSESTHMYLAELEKPVWLAVRRSSGVKQFFFNGLPWGAPSGTETTPTGGTQSVARILGTGTAAVGTRVYGGCKVVASALTDAEILAEYNRTFGPAFGYLT